VSLKGFFCIKYGLPLFMMVLAKICLFSNREIKLFLQGKKILKSKNKSRTIFGY